jgi:metallo-beta-lactamase family protein
MQKKPALVFVNHGDDESCTGLAGEIRSRFGVEAAAPYSGSVFDLKKGEWIRLTDPVWLKKEGRRNENTSASREKRSQLYRTLIENAEALVEYAERMKEHSNGEIRELTEKIRALMKG